jgi:murein DD-endopeptidase MepM/ murein hydrolase activator NlpD
VKYRALVVLGLTLPALPAQARSQLGTQPAPQDTASPTLLVARIANAFEVDLIPHVVVERLVRWQLGVRDMFHHAADRLSAFANSAGLALPDVTVLTWEPLAAANTTRASSGFGWRDDPIRHNRKFHSGADIRAQPGTPVMVAGDGVVSFAGRQGGYGNVIYVDHGGGVITRYAHLRRIETRKDAVVTAGTRIGQVGSTGRATGPHLHFEVRIDNHPVDPGTALTVAALQREAPSEGNLAAYALSPELQAAELSDLDPPKGRKAKTRSTETRPDRPGRTKRVRPTS